jgi:PAS domain S-box-containing protein
MKNPSDNWEELRQKVLGLGDSSVRKTHYPSLRQRLAELERLRSKLQQSEAYLLEAQRLSHTGSFGWRVSTGEILWSEETFRIFQYDAATKPTVDLVLQRVHPEDAAVVKETIERASQDGKDFDFEHRLLMPDGSVKYLHIVAHAISVESGSIEFVGAVMDITAAKQAEEKIRQNEKELRTIIETIPAYIGTNLPDGSVDYVSQSFLDYVGLSKEQWLDWGWTTVTHPEDLDRVVQRWRAHLAVGEPIEQEQRVRQKDSKYRWFLGRNVPLRDEKGNIVKWYGTLFDIDDRKQAEEALRKSEEQWRNVFENNPTMYFMVDAAGLILAVNPFGAEQLGYRIEELVGQPVLAVFLDSDREAAQRNVALCLQQPGQSMSWELRKVRKDGSQLWVRETARAILRANPPVVLIACEDITERKHAEERIREQEMELRQILDLAPQHVGVHGPDGSPLYANHAVLEYLGVDIDEWRAEGSRLDLVHPDDREHFLGERKRRFLDGVPHEFEARLLRHDGEFRWFLFRLNPLKDERGQITRWYGTATDIEDRKQAEDRLQQENVVLREEIDKASMFEEIVGASSALQDVLASVVKVAPTDSTVLITGETGTGKELIARAIHKRSPRSSRAFVSVNCAAIPPDLVASELFGHEKGAFTGASQRRVGRFELAEGGTIFLDEIGELPAETQIALLRVLQEREFERVGLDHPIRADVRVIAATNRDLEAAMVAGAFRSDLFYRVSVFPIEMPPLRERKEDIPMLVAYFIDRYASKGGKKIRGINKNTLDLLQSYPWPGNVRELQNVIERAVIVCETENLSVDASWLSQESVPAQPASQPLTKKPVTEEKELIEAALAESRGRVSGPSGAAAKLGMPPSTLESKIRSLKINKYRFKTD